MTRTRWTIVAAVASLGLAACESATSPELAPTSPLAARAATPTSCEIALNVESTRPLFAVHHLVRQLNYAMHHGGSSLSCGQVRSLEAKLDALVRQLDAQNFSAACGISGGLLDELAALVRTGRLDPAAPPPFPGGPASVLETLQFMNSRFCNPTSPPPSA